MTEPTTQTVEAPGAVLTYDVRQAASTSARPLLMVGSPMGAGGFVTLASLFGDRTVITYDPRGVERSTLTSPVDRTTPADHAADLRRVIEALGTDPVDVFASSGGAVNALELVAHHPALVHTLVAHEPPLADVVPDREHALAACLAISETYQRSGFGAGMAQFIALVSHEGEMTAEFAAAPGPDPAMFGLPTEDDGSRDDALLGRNMVPCTHHRLDFDALRAASTRVVVVAGAASGEQLAARGARAVAELLGGVAVTVPGDHGGFFGGEYGQTGEPEAFAAALRDLLDA